MTAITTVTKDQQERKRRRRKAAAVLAGGLVLGVGTMSTLASWNDSEFAQSAFKAGHFDLEGSTDGGATYSQHSTADAPGVLDFEVPATNLSPGDWAGGELKVRLAAGTTNDGLLRLDSAGSTGNLKGVAVYIWQDFEGSCAGKSYDVENAMGFSMDGRTYRGPQIAISKGVSADAAGDPITVCFAVSGGSSMPQGQNGAYKWKLTATSVTA